MAGLTSPETRAQLGAVALLRWRLLVNTARSLRGTLETVSSAVSAIVLVVVLGGVAAAAAALTYTLARTGHVYWTWVGFGFVMTAWQLGPLLAAAQVQAEDLSLLLRFPLRYPAYVLLQLAFGALNAWAASGTAVLAAMAVGAGLARPGLLAWGALVGAAFAALNLLLSRAAFAWLERWLARRRSRELLMTATLAIAISFQFSGALVGRLAGGHAAAVARAYARAEPLLRALPPVQAARSLAAMAEGRPAAAAGWLALLLAEGLLAFAVLERRLRGQYAGRADADSGAGAGAAASAAVARGWLLPGLSAPTAATFEKELRSYLRGGPFLFLLAMPAILVAFLQTAAAHPNARAPASPFRFGHALPLGAAYSLLMLSALVYDCLGHDGAGVQLLLASPARPREILLGKNLACAAALAAAVLGVWAAASVFGAPPGADDAWLTLAVLLLAVPADFAAGNLLSLYLPKKRELSSLNRRQQSQLSGLIGLALKAALFGVCALAVVWSRALGDPDFGLHALFVLAGPAWAVYLLVLVLSDEIMAARREVLLDELARA